MRIDQNNSSKYIKRRRFTVYDVQNSSFYQVPKFLFSNEFKKLSNDARMLHGMLKDRHELSMKNKWFTTTGEVYLIFTREEMVEMLGVSKPTAIKAMKSLIDFELLEEVRQGHMKPNIIFMYMYEQEYK